jgi:hypothetical protein
LFVVIFSGELKPSVFDHEGCGKEGEFAMTDKWVDRAVPVDMGVVLLETIFWVVVHAEFVDAVVDENLVEYMSFK